MPITSLYAGLAALLLLFLTTRVILSRRRHRVDMGDGGSRLLQRYVRAQANCVEYAPIGLLLLLLLEAGAWPAWLLHVLGLMLVAGRLAHAWSFSVEALRERSRVIGMTLTLAMLAVAACLCAVSGLRLG